MAKQSRKTAVATSPAPRRAVAPEPLGPLPGAILWVGVAALLAAATLTPMRDADIFFHIKAGETVLRMGIPHQDVFSHTAAGRPWMLNAWLSDLFLYLVHRAAGVAGLVGFQFALLLASFAILALLARRLRCETLIAAPAVALAVVAGGFRFTPRPELFSHLLTAITLWILITSRQDGHPRRLGWLPVVMLLWANLHMGFLVGLAIQAAFVVGMAVEKRGIRQSVAVLALSALATLVNPYGPRAWLFGQEFAGGGLFRKAIIEWRPLLADPPVGVVSMACLAILAAMAGLSWWRNRAKADMPGILLLIGLGLAALAVRRMAMPFALAACGVIVWNLRELRFPRPGLLAAAQAAGMLTATGMIVWLGVFPWREAGIHPLGRLVEEYPVGPAEFLERHPLPGRMFNTMPLGSYLLWRLGPRTKVFIDGRLDMYGSRIFDIYGRMHEQPGQFARLSRSYQIGYCVLAHPRGTEGLGTWLQEDRDWALLYWDESGMVFARRTPENQKIIRQFEYRNVTYPGVLRRSPELLRAEKTRVIAEIRRLMQDDPDGRLSNFAAGVALLGLGRMEPAREHLERALKADPEMLPAIAPLAAIYYQQRQYEKMPPLLERGVRVDPEDARLRLQLATAYLLTKQYRKAIGEARATLERDPTSFQAALVLAKVFAAEGNRDEALGWLERVRELAGPLPASEAAAREFDSIRNDPRFGEMIQP